MAAPATAVGDIFRVVVFCRVNDQNGLNVSYWKTTAITGVAKTIQGLADGLSTLLAVDLKALLCTEAEYLGLSMQRVVGGSTDPYTTSVSTGFGTAGDELMSSQTAGVFKLTTGLMGRTHRGRKYIPFPCEDSNDAAGVPSAGYLGNAATYAAKYVDDQNIGAGGDISSITAGLYHKASGIFDTFTNFTMRKNWGTQRRRSQINRPDARPQL